MSGRKIKPASARNPLFDEKHNAKSRRESNQHIRYDENAIPVILYNRSKEKHWENDDAEDDVPDFIPPQRKLVLNTPPAPQVPEKQIIQDVPEAPAPITPQVPASTRMTLFTETKNQIVNRFTKLMQKISAVFSHNS